MTNNLLLRPFNNYPIDSTEAPAGRLTQTVQEHTFNNEIVSTVVANSNNEGITTSMIGGVATNPETPLLEVVYQTLVSGQTIALVGRNHALLFPNQDGSYRRVEAIHETFGGENPSTRSIYDQTHLNVFPQIGIGYKALSQDEARYLINHARTLQSEKGDVFVTDLGAGETRITLYRPSIELLFESKLTIDESGRVTKVESQYMPLTTDAKGFQDTYGAESYSATYTYNAQGIVVDSVVARPNTSVTTSHLHEGTSIVTAVTTFNGNGPTPLTTEQAKLLCDYFIFPGSTMPNGTTFKSVSSSSEDSVTTEQRLFKMGSDTYISVTVKFSPTGDLVSARINANY